MSVRIIPINQLPTFLNNLQGGNQNVFNMLDHIERELIRELESHQPSFFKRLILAIKSIDFGQLIINILLLFIFNLLQEVKQSRLQNYLLAVKHIETFDKFNIYTTNNRLGKNLFTKIIIYEKNKNIKHKWYYGILYTNHLGIPVIITTDRIKNKKIEIEII